MKFYYQNGMGDNGFFSEKCLVKAIYTAWNIDAELYLVTNKEIKKPKSFKLSSDGKLVFSPLDDNEFNNELLNEFGYRVEDGDGEREIIDIKTDKIVGYDWSEVRQLI